MMVAIRQCQANKMRSPPILVDSSARTQLAKLNPPLGSYDKQHEDSLAKCNVFGCDCQKEEFIPIMSCLRHVRQRFCSVHPLKILNI